MGDCNFATNAGCSEFRFDKANQFPRSHDPQTASAQIGSRLSEKLLNPTRTHVER
jgi:hypothetical protein